MATHNSFASLGVALDAIAEQIEASVSTYIRETALNIVDDVTFNTPVDVGTARSNWRVGVGFEPTGIRNAYRPYRSRYASPPGPGGTRAERANLIATVATAKVRLTGHRGREAIYIVNNLPYIARLNDGSSRQSPRLFVQSGIKTGSRKTKFRLVKRKI